jgi:hypothetical protein
MATFIDLLRTVLPVIMFAAGFALNAWWERRKRRNNRSETALRELVTNLHEWHQIWQTLITACRDATTIDDLDSALESYRSRSTIAMRIDFSVSFPLQDPRTAGLDQTAVSPVGV